MSPLETYDRSWGRERELGVGRKMTSTWWGPVYIPRWVMKGSSSEEGNLKLSCVYIRSLCALLRAGFISKQHLFAPYFEQWIFCLSHFLRTKHGVQKENRKADLGTWETLQPHGWWRHEISNPLPTAPSLRSLSWHHDFWLSLLPTLRLQEGLKYMVPNNLPAIGKMRHLSAVGNQPHEGCPPADCFLIKVSGPTDSAGVGWGSTFLCPTLLEVSPIIFVCNYRFWGNWERFRSSNLEGSKRGPLATVDPLPHFVRDDTGM